MKDSPQDWMSTEPTSAAWFLRKRFHLPWYHPTDVEIAPAGDAVVGVAAAGREAEDEGLSPGLDVYRANFGRLVFEETIPFALVPPHRRRDRASRGCCSRCCRRRSRGR